MIEYIPLITVSGYILYILTFDLITFINRP